ncbi:hypothetical protein [Streptomyces violaceusniger]|uniref:Uncharacterized protein n=1 Tax=Streptomyces violaceusniger TaxID=68280 RepID=A0A4D4L000_STRVO|nr:hypothetical protein SVIO_027000 [Streptomyces violaceusniger]
MTSTDAVLGTYNVLTALACNLTRVADWIAEATTSHRRSTRFHSLCTIAA